MNVWTAIYAHKTKRELLHSKLNAVKEGKIITFIKILVITAVKVVIGIYYSKFQSTLFYNSGLIFCECK